MRVDYIPRNDAGLLAWSGQLSTKVSATPTAFGLSAPLATSLATKQAAYATALAASTNPATRGKSTIFAKDTARRDLVAFVRVVARQIQGTSTVTDQQRVDLGLPVRKVVPTPVPPPAISPGIRVRSVNGRVVRLQVFDPANPTRRARPAGVRGATVLSYVGAVPPENPADWRFEGSISKNLFDVAFPVSVAPGAKVFFTAFYFNPRSESGPACEAVSTHLQFGGDMLMAA
jgi:hypothetical protein